MSEALNKIILFANNQMNVKESVTSISVNNQRSINLITKLGFMDVA